MPHKKNEPEGIRIARRQRSLEGRICSKASNDEDLLGSFFSRLSSSTGVGIRPLYLPRGDTWRRETGSRRPSFLGGHGHSCCMARELPSVGLSFKTNVRSVGG